MKHFLLCLGGSQGVTIAFFDCIGRCVGTAPSTPRFAASICGFHRSGLRWFSPLGATFRFGVAAGRVDLRAHGFRFSARTASGLPSAGWPSGSPLPLFGTRRFGVATRRVGLRAHRFRFSACTASGLSSAGWPSGSRLPLFGMRRSAPPCRRREGRRSTPTRHLFHFKTLIPTC